MRANNLLSTVSAKVTPFLETSRLLASHPLTMLVRKTCWAGILATGIGTCLYQLYRIHQVYQTNAMNQKDQWSNYSQREMLVKCQLMLEEAHQMSKKEDNPPNTSEDKSLNHDNIKNLLDECGKLLDRIDFHLKNSYKGKEGVSVRYQLAFRYATIKEWELFKKNAQELSDPKELCDLIEFVNNDKDRVFDDKKEMLFQLCEIVFQNEGKDIDTVLKLADIYWQLNVESGMTCKCLNEEIQKINFGRKKTSLMYIVDLCKIAKFAINRNLEDATKQCKNAIESFLTNLKDDEKVQAYLAIAEMHCAAKDFTQMDEKINQAIIQIQENLNKSNLPHESENIYRLAQFCSKHLKENGNERWQWESVCKTINELVIKFVQVSRNETRATFDYTDVIRIYEEEIIICWEEPMQLVNDTFLKSSKDRSNNIADWKALAHCVRWLHKINKNNTETERTLEQILKKMKIIYNKSKSINNKEENIKIGYEILYCYELLQNPDMSNAFFQEYIIDEKTDDEWCTLFRLDEKNGVFTASRRAEILRQLRQKSLNWLDIPDNGVFKKEEKFLNYVENLLKFDLKQSNENFDNWIRKKVIEKVEKTSQDVHKQVRDLGVFMACVATVALGVYYFPKVGSLFSLGVGGCSFQG